MGSVGIAVLRPGTLVLVTGTTGYPALFTFLTNYLENDDEV